MAGVTWTAEVDKLAKRIYSKEAINNLQNQAAETFPKLKRSSGKLGGSKFYFPILTSGNQEGQGSQNELEALRTADKQAISQGYVEPKVFTHTIQVSGLSLEMLKGNEESFANNLTLQMDEGMKDSVKELNKQVFRCGSGILAQVNNAVVTSTDVIFDNGIPTHFAVGMPIDVINAGVKEINGVKIAAIDIPNLTIVLASAQSCTNDMYIYRAGMADNAPTAGKELEGFPKITDDGTDFATYEGVTRTGAGYVDSFKGLEINASAANLSDDMLQRAIAKMKVYAGTKPDKIVSNTSQVRKYISLTLPQVTFSEGDKRDSSKAATRAWNGIAWDIDTDCGFDEIYLYDSNLVERFDVYDCKFDDSNGNILKWRDGYDVFMAYAKYYGNIGSQNPRGAMIRIHTLAQPTF